MGKAISLAIAAVAVVVALGGCGSDGVESVASMGKIIEYAGDGGGSLKPPAPFMPAPEVDTRAAVGNLLSAGSPALARTVPAKNTAWFRIAPRSTAQTVSGDPDLFVYRQTSAGWVGSDVNVGGGAVSFTAAAGPYYIRVHGFSTSNFSLWVQDV